MKRVGRFLGHHEQHPPPDVFLQEDDFWRRAHTVIQRLNCACTESSGLFPHTLSLMKVAKSPGGWKSTVCLCWRENSRGTGGRREGGGGGMWGGAKLWESRLTERRDREVGGGGWGSWERRRDWSFNAAETSWQIPWHLQIDVWYVCVYQL